MVCGTSSDAGKTTVVTGLCRLLARRGMRVAPFKAQNMALNSMVTVDGAEIGRAQAAQAGAAGVEPEAAMNPVLLKPTSNHTSQVVVMGRPWRTLDAREFQEAKRELWPTVTAQLEDLRSRFDVVVCEGAGSPAEINLLENDLVNLRLAHHAGLPALLVGDIDRGGVFASVFGTVSLLPGELAKCVRGFVINKFRGDRLVLQPGLDELERKTGLVNAGVLPWMDGMNIDAEDSLALPAHQPTRLTSRSGAIDVAVIRLPRISNFTDVDALMFERDVAVRFVEDPRMLGRPDLVVLPGTKATLSDLDWLRGSGLAQAIADLATRPEPSPTVLGICGGYQMMGEKIDDAVESTNPRIENGLGLLPVTTTFAPEKVTCRRSGTAFGERITGYEIHHGRTPPSSPWVHLDDPGLPGKANSEGSSAHSGKLLGTALHGILESDRFRRAFLSEVARRAGKRWHPGDGSFPGAREARYDRIADAIEQHLDMAFIDKLIAGSTGVRP
jgi:adenosylcobyric acid synthase